MLIKYNTNKKTLKIMTVNIQVEITESLLDVINVLISDHGYKFNDNASEEDHKKVYTAIMQNWAKYTLESMDENEFANQIDQDVSEDNFFEENKYLIKK